jgi:SAM-dependent methyltransferase
MLAQARTHAADARIDYVRAAAEVLPLPDAHVDLVFMSMVFHHFDEPERAAHECRRVLRAGGSVLLRTPTRERADVVASLRFFPGARALFEQRIPSAAHVIDTFERAGFTLLCTRPIEQELAPNWRAYAERVALKGDSILASLPEQDFDTGLRALRLHATLARSEPIREPIDFFVFR